jgi:diguanylate cyclase (GGDEF)-like protein
MRTTTKPKTPKRPTTPRRPRTPATPAIPRVLVADDSKLARAAIRTVLENEFEVIEAEDGDLAWKALIADDGIRVVITDANMPNLDGYGLIERIRGSDEVWIKHIPVVMVTGVEEKNARTRALEIGVTDFFTKPVYKTVFLDKVRTHVHLGQTTRKLIETSAALAEEGAVDQVTGVNSRRYFVERVAQDLAYAKRHAQSLSIIFLEVDQYDEIIGTDGEDAAEHLLFWLAQQLKETVRIEDTIARLQGSRFAVTMLNSGRLEAAVLGDRLRKLVTATEFVHNDNARNVTVSLCLVSAGRDPVETVDDFFDISNRRLERARGEGGNRMISSDTAESQVEESMTALMAHLDEILQEATRRGDAINPYLSELADRAVTILELANNNLELGIVDGVRYIRAKIGLLKRETGR